MYERIIFYAILVLLPLAVHLAAGFVIMITKTYPTTTELPEDIHLAEGNNGSESEDVSYFMEEKITNYVDGFDSNSESASETRPAQSSRPLSPYSETPAPDEYKRVCVFPNWSILRDSVMARIYPEDIDPFLCTHIHYAYANIDIRNFQLTPSQYEDFKSGIHGDPLYERIMRLRERNPKLKILISIGGWFAKSTPFNLILTSNVTRNVFIENVLEFLRIWRFDGLDIQWIYPGSIEFGATVHSKEKFTSLIKVDF